MSACVGLGANLGDTRAVLAAAYCSLQQLPSTRHHRCSPWFISAPVDSSGPDYLNAVACFDTSLSPHALLEALQGIERSHGRERPYRNAPRTLDLDLLLYGDQQIESATLTVPHPRMHERAFVLLPLATLLPGAVIPGRGPVSTLMSSVAGQSVWPAD
ncbi:MAG: 2-amino-4-hydroxy-6-hydroxymethyldihydropteridine diphosphokinase [Burkholderiales bacterium PBB1]|nr:MAG: 2-amino-4-hydroxy-6-hydroxymethyldihydropteridine diphosphokinase [Burkholderiales bacterium PBB1]